MDPLLYVIAILGCGEGDAPCDELGLAEAHYASREACVAATAEILPRHADRPYPVVVAQCRRVGEPPLPLTAGDVRLPDGGRLPAERAPDTPPAPDAAPVG